MPSIDRSERVGDLLEGAPVVALWGLPGSGKSGIVGALQAETGRTVGGRWAVQSDALDAEARAYVESASLALRRRGVRETVIHRPSIAMLPLVRRDGSRDIESMQLLVIDPAGLHGSAADGDLARRRQIAMADGLVWLFEVPATGTLAPVSRAALLREIVSLLAVAERPQLEMPVALCLTKIDRLTTPEMQRALGQPAEALRAMLGPAAFGWLEAAFPHFSCFALSAAGTVRNTIRPAGLTAALDWFGAERRRAARAAEAAARRSRRSAEVARISGSLRRLGRFAIAAAFLATIGLGTVWTAMRLHVGRTWTASTGTLAVDSSAPAPVHIRLEGEHRDAAGSTLLQAVDAYRHGDIRQTLRVLARLRIRSGGPEAARADSLIALAALRGTEEALNGGRESDVLPLVVATTSGAIDRGSPGTYALAPLYLARAGACIGGELGCPDRQVREDLAWVLLLGSPEQQDAARRLRAAWAGDTSALPSLF